jgi:eukaryotic-like serine/threonine-protein kinase
MKSDQTVRTASPAPSTDNSDSQLDDPRVVHAVQGYLAALEAGDPPDRQTYINQHPEIATELAECLAGLDFVHAAAGNWRETPIEAIATDHAVTNSPLPLGDFKIVREIGRGGMGVVYEAVQLSLGRRVALKVLPFAAALDRKQLQRFKNEAQAAAQLHHNNIVPVYAVGCERGVHFYAMQLIQGQPLSVLIRQMRSLAGRDEAGPDGGSVTSILASNLASGRWAPARPTSAAASPLDREQRSNDPSSPDRSPSEPAAPWDSSSEVQSHTRLSHDTTAATAALTTHHSSRGRYFRTVAELGRQAAEALEHAHTVGVIHRDVKPGNLLVDQQGNVWITDFGLAQFHAEAGLTRTGDMMGTLRYMSPEQAIGNRVVLDHRTDIYSLGVTLYELLTLEPVFASSDRADLLRRIIEDEPKSMQSLEPSIPVELETIVLKALAKAPVERYGTAQDLADDLKRFLNDEPIRARRPTPLERVTKWSRRHRGLVISAVLLLATATAGFAASTILLFQMETESRASYQRETEARSLAVENFRQAQQAVDVFTHLSDEELPKVGPLQRVRRRFLQTALEYYQGFLGQHSDDPSLEQELVASSARASQLLEQLAMVEAERPTLLFMDPVIQHELASSPEQQTEMSRISGTFEHDKEQLFKEYIHLSHDDRDSRLANMMRQYELRIADILTPEQMKRLRQISLQQDFGRAFSDPRVVDALQLTSEQRTQIRAIQDEAQVTIINLWPNDFKESRQLWEQTWREAITRIVELLTPEQQAAWQQLIGTPFEGELRFRPPGGWLPR